MYGKVVNGSLTYAPENFLTEDGKMIFSFNSQPALMAEHGFKKVVDEIPEYDSRLYRLKIKGFTEDADSITVVYKLELIEVDPAVKKASEQALAFTFLGEMLTDEQALQVVSIFADWEVGVEYKVGKKLKFNNILYKVIKAHTSVAKSTPDVTPGSYEVVKV